MADVTVTYNPEPDKPFDLLTHFAADQLRTVEGVLLASGKLMVKDTIAFAGRALSPEDLGEHALTVPAEAVEIAQAAGWTYRVEGSN